MADDAASEMVVMPDDRRPSEIDFDVDTPTYEATYDNGVFHVEDSSGAFVAACAVLDESAGPDADDVERSATAPHPGDAVMQNPRRGEFNPSSHAAAVAILNRNRRDSGNLPPPTSSSSRRNSESQLPSSPSPPPLLSLDAAWQAATVSTGDEADEEEAMRSTPVTPAEALSSKLASATRAMKRTVSEKLRLPRSNSRGADLETARPSNTAILPRTSSRRDGYAFKSNLPRTQSVDGGSSPPSRRNSRRFSFVSSEATSGDVAPVDELEGGGWFALILYSIAASVRVKSSTVANSTFISEEGRLAVHPFSIFSHLCDNALSAILLFTAIEVPYSAAFDSMAPVRAPMIALDVALLLLWIKELATATYYVADDAFEISPYFTATSYPMRKLMLLFTALPLEACVPVRLASYARLPKLLALFIVAFDPSATAGIVSARRTFRVIMRMLKLFAFFCYVVHVMACMLYGLSLRVHDWSLHGDPEERRRHIPWTEDAGILPDQGMGRWHAYVVSASLALSLVTGAGANTNVTVTQTAEMCMTLLATAAGCVFYAYVLGSVLELIELYNCDINQFYRLEDQLQRFCENRNVPHELHGQMMRNFAYQWTRTRFINENDVMTHLSLPLQNSLKRHLCRAIIEKVPIFSGASATFVDDVVGKLRPRFAGANEVLCVEEQVGYEMYILARGKVEVYKTEKVVELVASSPASPVNGGGDGGTSEGDRATATADAAAAATRLGPVEAAEQTEKGSAMASAISRMKTMVRNRAGTAAVADAVVKTMEAAAKEKDKKGATRISRIAVLSDGAFFGEISLVVEDATRIASVRALVPCDLYELTREDFDDVARQYPGEVSRVRLIAWQRKETTNRRMERQRSQRASGPNDKRPSSDQR